jgi:GxxExxY protein
MIPGPKELLFKEECFVIVGLAMKVHNQLGRGFREIVYKDALEIEFKRNCIPYKREEPFKIIYDQVILPRRFNADFLLYGSIMLEAKATAVTPYDAFCQTLNYLKAAKVKLGIIINFGMHKLEFKRVVCTY